MVRWDGTEWITPLDCHYHYCTCGANKEQARQILTRGPQVLEAEVIMMGQENLLPKDLINTNFN